MLYGHIPFYTVTADDILLEPRYGLVKSRNDIKTYPFLINAPMIASAGADQYLYAMVHDEWFSMPRQGPLLSELPYLLSKTDPKWFKEKLFFAVGTTQDKHWEELLIPYALKYNTKINVIIDIAHGYSVNGLELIKAYRSLDLVNFIMTGSIGAANQRLVNDLHRTGATHFRMGIGNGSACTTRLETGVGYSQLSLIIKMNDILWKTNLTKEIVVISDGGLEKPADAVKYLAAGADLIMSGKQFAKTLESGGWEYHINEDRWDKQFFGHASQTYKDLAGISNGYIEGKEFIIHDMILLSSLYERYYAGVASACSYLGVESFTDLKDHEIYYNIISSTTQLENTVRGN